MSEIDELKDKRVDIEAFGYKFTNLYPGLASDLVTLEKEGAIYVQHYDKSIDKFNHYKVKLLPKEIVEYVQAYVAQEEFHEGLKKYKDFDKALDNVSNKKIVERVKSYDEFTERKMGEKLPVSLKGCFASFLTEELEELSCFHTNPNRYELLPRINTQDKIAIILDVFNAISNSINFLANRKHDRPPFKVENEYDVHDLLYVILKPIFPDARIEEYTPKHADGSKRIDIVIPSIDVVIELKYVKDKNQVKKVIDEIKIDIESYFVHPNCKILCVLIYDPEKGIMDPENVVKDLSGLRKIQEKEFDVKTIIKN